MSKDSSRTQFGMFHPTGYVVVAFPGDEEARKVQQDLVTGGFDEADCRLVGPDEVRAAAQRHLDNASTLGMLGATDEFEQQHLETARRGYVFMMIYAPGDVMTDRVMRVVHRVRFEFAHRYHRLAIQALE